MKIAERSYSGKVFRPRPEIYCESEGQLCIVAIPWGQRNVARKTIQLIVDFFMSANSDREVTSPFEILPQLSPAANNLRVALRLANDTIFREENRSEYQSGVEILALCSYKSEVCWVQVGGPAILLDRPGFELQYLSTFGDLSLQYSNSVHLLAPLPAQLLGTAPTSNFSVNSYHAQSDDRLVLVQRGNIPARFQCIPQNERNLNKLSHTLAAHSTELPFWLGLLEL